MNTKQHPLSLNEKRAYLAALFRSTDVTPSDRVKIITADNELYKLQLAEEAREKAKPEDSVLSQYLSSRRRSLK